MNLIILLFAIGVVLIAAEVIVPGGILGGIGAVSMLAGCVAAFMKYGSGGGALATLAAVVTCALVLWIEFRILPKTKLGKRAFLTEEISAVATQRLSSELIGKSGEAITMLSPSGYVLIDGKRYEALCQNGQAAAGSALKVIGIDDFNLIVSLKS